MSAIPIGASAAPGSAEFERARKQFEAATADDDSGPVPPIDWSILQGEPPPRSWWIQDWLGPDPTLVAGAGGIGKTTLMQTLGTGLATGFPYLGASARDLQVLIWLCEDGRDDVWRRQVAINRHFGVDMDDLGSLHVVPRRGEENTLLQLMYGVPTLTPAFTDLYDQVNDLKIDVLILDNLAQIFGGNESDRHHATVFVNALAGIVRGRPFAPILLGHTARAQGSEFSGSAAWENACRMRWYLGSTLPDQKPDTDDENLDVVYLCRRKANYTGKDWRRLQFRNGVLVPEDPAIVGPSYSQAHRDEAAEELVIAGMRKLAEMGIQPTDGKTSPDYLPSQLIAKRLHGAHTKAELTGAMNRLMRNGRLRRDVIGRYANRTPKHGLVLVT